MERWELRKPLDDKNEKNWTKVRVRRRTNFSDGVRPSPGAAMCFVQRDRIILTASNGGHCCARGRAHPALLPSIQSHPLREPTLTTTGSSLACGIHSKPSKRKNRAAKPPEASVQRAGSFTSLALPCVLLALLVVIVFARALPGDWIEYDDGSYVRDNSHVNSGLSAGNLAWAAESFDCCNWHPLTWLSHMLDCQVYGLNTSGHHLTSILLHALNVVLIFLVLKWFTGASGPSFAVAALFGIHPLRVESVAWICERKDVLSVTFALATVLAYGVYAARARDPAPGPSRNRRPWYLLTVLLFVCALMSKPMAVTLPFVLLLLDYWPLQRWPGKGWRALAVEKIPFFLLTTAACAITFAAQRSGGVMNELASMPLSLRVETAVIAYVRYLGKIVWPANLCALYPHPGRWPVAAAAGAGILLAAITFAAWRRRRDKPFVLFGWLWFLGTLVPVIGLVQAGPQSMADRYSYFPSVGALIAVIWPAWEFCRARGHLQVFAIAAAALAATASIATVVQIGNWTNDIAVWQRAIAVTGDNFAAHHRLGRAYFARKQFADAASQFREVIRLRPDFAEGHNFLAVTLVSSGEAEAAIHEYREAIRLNPIAARHHNLGSLLFQLGRRDEARREFEEVVRLKPDQAIAHNFLGVIACQEGRLDDGIHEFQESLRLQPDLAQVRDNLSAALQARNEATHSAASNGP
jgi:tetratricopeptide (TPR) repeat protein